MSLSALSAACGPGDSSSAVAATWCYADAHAVPVAFTPADDPGAWNRAGRSQPRFVELWRAGGLNANEQLAFPLNAAASASGRLAIADWMLQTLVVVEPDGDWTTWMRPGEGPGELARPGAVVWAGDTDTLAVYDLDNSRIVFAWEGRPARPDLLVLPAFTSSLMAAGEIRWLGVLPDGGVVAAPVPPTNPNADEAYVSAPAPILHLAPGSASVDTVGLVQLPTIPRIGLTAPGWPKSVAAVSSGGMLAVGGTTSSYSIRRLDAAGRSTDVICRSSSALPLEGRELQAPADANPRLDSLARSLASAPRPDSLAPYGRLFFSGDGQLWVQRERPAALRFGDSYHGVPGALYDVFDADGRYLGEVRAPANARLQAALGDTVWAYEIGELDETWVVAYELRWEEE